MKRRAAISLATRPTTSGGSLWRSPTLWLSLAGGALLWASFPPLDLWPLAWLAPLPWLWLVRLPHLPGRRPYLAIGTAGFAHWLVMLQGIRLAHPALYGGWILLSAYLAFYLPIFVGLARVAVHKLRMSLVIAAPVVWVGLELVRGHFATGFSAALLSHTQVPWTTLLQIADLSGAYAVSFVMMLVTACFARLLPMPARLTEAPELRRWSLWPAPVALLALAATLGYGTFRLWETPPLTGREPLRVALIQGSLDTIFTPMTSERFQQTFAHYRRLTDQARRENERLDLVVWPESMFVLPQHQAAEPFRPPPNADASPDEIRRRVAAMNEDFSVTLAGEAARVNRLPSGENQATPTFFVIGTTTLVWGADRSESFQSYNAALLADPQGKVVGRYDKTHAVMFGEYIPLGDWLPWIYRVVPMAPMSVGDGPRAFEVAGLRLSPSICFESVLPHLIRRQVLQLEGSGQPVDVLVNVTNDGWFWGSSILDLHFRCAVFRAIENRKPVIIAANTGISGWIDGNGTIRAQGPRHEPAVIVAEVRPDGRRSPYQVMGDVPAWLCTLACLGLAVIGCRGRRNQAATMTAGK